MSDGTAFRAAGVRLKKMRGSGFRCETDHSCFEFTSAEASVNLGFSRGIAPGFAFTTMVDLGFPRGIAPGFAFTTMVDGVLHY